MLNRIVTFENSIRNIFTYHEVLLSELSILLTGFNQHTHGVKDRV